MWTKIITWLISGSSVWAYAVCFSGGFGIGGYLTHKYYTGEILEISCKSQELQIKLEKERNEALSRVVSKQFELDTWRNDANKRIANLSHSVQLAESRAKRAEKSAKGAYAAGESSCRQLLVRGTAVVGRCAEVLGDTVVKHDSLVEFYQ